MCDGMAWEKEVTLRAIVVFRRSNSQSINDFRAYVGPLSRFALERVVAFRVFVALETTVKWERLIFVSGYMDKKESLEVVPKSSIKTLDFSKDETLRYVEFNDQLYFSTVDLIKICKGRRDAAPWFGLQSTKLLL